MKKIILLTVVLFVSASAWTQEYEVTWDLDATGTLTISGPGVLQNQYTEEYTEKEGSVPPWYSDRSAIQSVVIDNGVTSIRDYAFRDCTNLTSVIIGRGITSIGWYAFSGCTSLTSIAIPESVEFIGAGAFWGCSSLTDVVFNAVNCMGTEEGSGFSNCSSLTTLSFGEEVTNIPSGAFYGCSGLISVACHALEPPMCDDYTFWGINADCILYIPIGTQEQYEFAVGWRSFGSIIEFAEGMQKLKVNLSDAIDKNLYKNLSIEVSENDVQLFSLTSGNSSNYTFNVSSGTYKVTVKGKYGDILGEIDVIEIEEQDKTVSFSSLAPLYTVKLNISDTQNLSGTPAVKWYDENNTLLQQGDVIAGVAKGMKLKYKVEFNETWGKVYGLPPVTDYTVADGNNTIQLSLQKIPEVTIQGVVKNENGSVLSDALVSITQLLNGKYSQTKTVKTDREGKFSTIVSNDSTVIIASYTDYLSQTLSFRNFSDGTDLGIISLPPIAGARITLNLSHTKSVLAGETPVVENWYADYLNVDYTLFNRTKNREITQFAVQYPEIVIIEPVEAGDEIQVTAISRRTNEFKQVQNSTVIDDELRAAIQLNIVQQGYIRASYTGNGNAQNTGILYDSTGKLVNKFDYANGLFESGNLPDGSYSLVSMSKSRFFNSVLNLSALSSSGLVQNTDYILQQLTVKTGEITEVTISSIPMLDESKLYYTGDKTLFSVNKTSITAGNYLTLRAELDFKAAYTGIVSNVKLIVDIPEQCSFVNSSLTTGSVVSGSYSMVGNRLTVPLADYSDIVRFCIIPLQEGNHAPNAFVEFDLEGSTITQPIGAAGFAAEGLTVSVPILTAQKEITIRGTAIGKSEITIYDGDVLIGRTQALASGEWSLECELYKPYALSYHNIHAEVITAQGLTLRTETKEITHNITAIVPSKVTMINVAHPATSLDLCEYITVFDFLDPPKKGGTYWYWPSYPDFTFKIEFTKNDPDLISDVILYVSTSAEDTEVLPATYDPAKQLWIATGEFDSYRLPVNVSVDYVAETEPLLDREYLNEAYSLFGDIQDEYRYQIQFIDSISTLINVEMEKDEIDYDYIKNLREELDAFMGIDPHNNVDTSIEDFLNGLNDDEFLAYMQSLLEETDALLATSSNLQEFLDASIYGSIESTYNDVPSTLQISTCDGYVESKLIEQGFTVFETTDGNYIYVKYTDNESVFIDFHQDMCIITYLDDDAKIQMLRSSDDESKLAIIGDAITKINDCLSPFYEKMSTIERTLLSIASHFNSRYIDLLDREVLSKNSLEFYKKLPYDQRGPNYANDVYRHQDKINKLQVEKNMALATENTIAKCLSAAGKLVGLIDNMHQSVKTINAYIDLYYEVPDNCEQQHEKAESLKGKILTAGVAMGGFYVGKSIADGIGLYTILTSAATIIPTMGASSPGVAAGLTEMGISLTLGWATKKMNEIAQSTFASEIKQLKKIKCDDEPPCDNCPDPNSGGGSAGGAGGKYPSNNPPADFVMDPSGYVYEAVPSNRLEGVTATIYFKTQEEDMYGDLEEVIVLWDAEEYGQINPMLTNEYGEYGWDVPTGIWQVKYEKDGYKTIFSEWLPVPPPQLDVNMAKVQPVQPTVQKVQGYESGINIEFDKFMLPFLMTTQYIKVTRNGNAVSGTIALLNEEAGAGSTFVSRVRFIPDSPFETTDEVILTVKREVKSYAEIEMAEDFVQRVEIQKEMTSITAPPVLDIILNGNEFINVSVEPLNAAGGKKIIARSASPSIASVIPEAVLDAEGKATLQVIGELPGSTVIHISIEETELKAEVAINVAMPKVIEQVAKPTASISSGSTVENNTIVTLSTATEGASIYYTEDGSTPTQTTGLEYIQPIVITQDVAIRAIAIKEGMRDSDIATFQYFRTGIYQVENGNITIYAYPNPVKDILYINSNAVVESVMIYDTVGKLIIKQTNTTGGIDVSELRNGTYIIKIQTNTNITTQKIVKN